MQSTREEQKEALETLVEFNERLLKNMKIIVKELSGARLDDTDIFLADILKAINWEIQVTNGTIELLNEKERNIDKNVFNAPQKMLKTCLMSNANCWPLHAPSTSHPASICLTAQKAA